MKYIKQFGIIMGISFAGEMLRFLLPFPMPASIYGLLLMFGALCTGILKLEQVENAADFLVEIMPLMFIPAGVGLMEEWEVLSKIWFPFVVIIAVSTVAVMAVTGCVTQYLIQCTGQHKGSERGLKNKNTHSKKRRGTRQ